MERCERCGAEHGVRFVCLGRRLCYACANTVVRLTRRFPALHDIAASELAETVSEQVDTHDRNLAPAPARIPPR